MKRIIVMLGGTTLVGMLAVSVVSFAQTPQPAQEGNIVIQKRVVHPDGTPPPPPGDTFVFVANEVGFRGDVVKDAPYSAQSVTETIQTLSDGNRIVNKNTSSIYRDSEGRTRREQTLKMIGGVGNSGEPLQTIFISDPVAGVSYALDSRTHVAHKSMPFRFERTPLPAGAPGLPPPGPDGQRFEYRVGPGAASTVVVGSAGIAPTVTRPALPGPPPDGERFTVTTEAGGNMSYVVTRKMSGPDNNEVKESLGKQSFDGVEAEGTRTTITIPAGEIGNERAIDIVDEHWYSPELKVVVMTRHTDPRFGETTYRLTNINRSEPAKSLFEIPGDYTIKEGMPAPTAAPLPARVRKPGNPE